MMLMVELFCDGVVNGKASEAVLQSLGAPCEGDVILRPGVWSRPLMDKSL